MPKKAKRHGETISPLCSICEDREVTQMTKLGICDTCYHGMYYWRGKSVRQIMNRQKQLEVFQRRMSLLKGANR
jgi:hypothetical protein